MRTLATCALLLGWLDVATARGGTIAGRVIDSASAPVAGVSVYARDDGEGHGAAVTDPDGRFAIDAPAGDYTVTFFFGEVAMERRGIHVADDGAPATWISQRLPAPWTSDEVEPPPAPVPAWTATAPLLARRDHLGLAALDPRIRPGTTVTTISGALRLPGAPPIVGEFVDRLTAQVGPADAALPGASGGTLDATLVTPPARMAGLIALELGPDARFVALHTAAIDHGHTWWSTGVALARTGATAGREGEHQAQLMTTMGAADEASGGGQVNLIGTWLGDGGRDLWGDAQGTLRTDEARHELTFGITGETLTPPAGAAIGRASSAPAPAVDRVAGRLALTRRWRGAGGHATRIGGEVGMGRADAAEHGDVRAYLDDTWRPTASWRIAAAVRWDRRELGTARADAVLPRLVVAWEPTRADALTLFAAAERVARLDEVQLGAWRDGAAPGVDRAAVGASRALTDDVQLEVALRGRRPTGAGAPPERGVDGVLRWLPRGGFAGELAGSTLEGVATARASYARTRGTRTLGVAAIGRLDRAGHGWGAAAQWTRRVGGARGQLRGALELFDLDDARARSGRLTLTAAW